MLAPDESIVDIDQCGYRLLSLCASREPTAGYNQPSIKADTMQRSALSKLNTLFPSLQFISKCLFVMLYPRLIPCLRKFGIKFYAFSPLAYVMPSYL
jgi:hypothetical protein